MDKSFLKAAEDALLDAFQNGFESAFNGLKNATFRVVESVLTDFAPKGALDDTLDKNIKKCVQASSFMGALARRTLISTNFVCKVAKFIREKSEMQTGKIEEIKKIAKVPFSFSPSTPLSLEASADLEKRRNERKART